MRYRVLVNCRYTHMAFDFADSAEAIKFLADMVCHIVTDFKDGGDLSASIEIVTEQEEEKESEEQ